MKENTLEQMQQPSFAHEDFSVNGSTTQSEAKTYTRRDILYAGFSALTAASLFSLFSQPASAQRAQKKDGVKQPQLPSDIPPRKEGIPRPMSKQLVDYLRGYRLGEKKIDGFIARLAAVSKSKGNISDTLNSLRKIPVAPAPFALPDPESNWLYGRYNEKGFEQGENGELPWPTMSLAYFVNEKREGVEDELPVPKGAYSGFLVKTAKGSLTCLPAPILRMKLKEAKQEDPALDARLKDGKFASMYDAHHSGRNAQAPVLELSNLRSADLHGHWTSIPFLAAGHNKKGELDRRHPTYMGGPTLDISTDAGLYAFFKKRITDITKDEKTRDAMISTLRYANIVLVMSENQWAPIEHEGFFHGILGAPTFRSMNPETTSAPEQSVTGQALFPIQLSDGPQPRWAIVVTKPEALREARDEGVKAQDPWK